jgi:hypothetical protein
MSLLAAVVESSPANYYFQLSDTSGGTDIFQSPFEVQSKPDAFGALNISVTDAQSAVISAQANNGAGINAAAVLQLGCPSSTQAVTISNNGTQDQLNVGRPGVAGLLFSSSAAAGGVASITTDSTVGTEVINIGPTTNAPTCIVVGPGNAFTVANSPYTSQVVVPELANGTGTIGNTFASALTNPVAPGLYAVMVACSTATSIAAQISSVCYFNGTKWSAGGVAEVTANFVGNVTLAPAVTTAFTLVLTNNSGASLQNISYCFVPIINGFISGMP